ncbi:hypothetical protein N431DRAFT_475355 [Stipitochalara longipes BDJ]|nr:hypothetical protein N431DRAFT_475355 [Stipitochalara longipes BDJ]
MSMVSLATYDGDHVFALLGLVAKFSALSSPQNQASILVDYALSTHEVYLWTALYLAKSSGSLKFLSAAGSLPRPSKNKLPSWVLDWSVPLVKYPLMGLEVSNCYNNYNACTSQWRVFELSNPENRPSVKGALFDYVLVIGDAMQGWTDQEKVHDHRLIFLAWRLMIQDNPNLFHGYNDVYHTF